MIYVLIVVWQVGGSNGLAMESQEFNSLAACEHAKQAMTSEFAIKWSDYSKPIGVCVPK